MANSPQSGSNTGKIDEPERDYLNVLNKEFNICLVGEAGSGKSSFVNAIIRYNRVAADIDVINPTSKAECYIHPNNENIKIWDLPGLGTAAYPDTKTYYERLQLADKYDAFLLFTRTRFTIDSQRLAIRLQPTKKPLVFIRTCIDDDARNEKKTKPKGFKEGKMIEEIRKNILEGLKDLNSVSGEEIFLISNVQPKKWDFDRLYKEILSGLARKSSTCTPFTDEISAKFQLAKISLQERREKLKVDAEALLKFIKKYRPGETRAIRKEGIERAQKLMKEELDEWENIKITLAIIGKSGAGKSSFINAIRGITNYDDKDAAETGPTQTTMTPEEFLYPKEEKLLHPKKGNITFWDCPGFGPADFPDIETYCRKIDFEKYDAFIIMTDTRFNAKDGDLASKLQSIGKPFFFARMKIDQDCYSKKYTSPSSYNEVKMLNDIKRKCSQELKKKGVKLGDEDIFLVSSFWPCKWDFARLTEAIHDRLPFRKRECFLFSMLFLSEHILERKVEALRGRVKFVAFFQSMIMKPFTTTGYSLRNDFGLIVKKVEFYRSQLGFPKQGSKELQMMSQGLQNKVRRFYLTSDIDVKSWLSKFDTAGGDEDTAGGDENTEFVDEEEDCGVEEESLSWLDVCKAISAPYNFVSNSLHHVLDEMKEIALAILKETAARSQPDLH